MNTQTPLIIQTVNENDIRGVNFILKGDIFTDEIRLLWKQIKFTLDNFADTIKFIRINLTKANDTTLKVNRLVESICYFKEIIEKDDLDIDIYVQMRNIQRESFPALADCQCFIFELDDSDFLNLEKAFTLKSEFVPRHKEILLAGSATSTDNVINSNDFYRPRSNVSEMLISTIVSNLSLIHKAIEVVYFVLLIVVVSGIVISIVKYLHTIIGFMLFFCSGTLFIELLYLRKKIIIFKETIYKADNGY